MQAEIVDFLLRTQALILLFAEKHGLNANQSYYIIHDHFLPCHSIFKSSLTSDINVQYHVNCMGDFNTGINILS